MAIEGGLTAPTVVRERFARWFSAIVTIYFGFLAVFIPLKYFSGWVKHAPRSATDVYLVIIAVALILGCYRAWRLALRFDGSGITVRNYFRTYRIGWSEVKCFTDGAAGMATGNEGRFQWALRIGTHERRPVVASATVCRYGARPEILTAIWQQAELHDVTADMTGVAKTVRPRRRYYAGDIALWLVIMFALLYLLSLTFPGSY